MTLHQLDDIITPVFPVTVPHTMCVCVWQLCEHVHAKCVDMCNLCLSWLSHCMVLTGGCESRFVHAPPPSLLLLFLPYSNGWVWDKEFVYWTDLTKGMATWTFFCDSLVVCLCLFTLLMCFLCASAYCCVCVHALLYCCCCRFWGLWSDLIEYATLNPPKDLG